MQANGGRLGRLGTASRSAIGSEEHRRPTSGQPRDVAIRYVLDRPAVAGVIVGVRLGVADHREDNAQVFGFELGPEDLDKIKSVLSRSQDPHQLIGDCGDEYRR